jgi:hypothetical protein
MPTEDQNSQQSHQGVLQGGAVELSLDELAKGLATGTLSRGKAIRWMGGALLGAALASVPGVAWANDCRRLGRECRRDSQCCSKNCIRQGDEKVCACPEGKTPCNERCVNLERNDNNCGCCGNRCADDQECVGGVCQGGPECQCPLICGVVSRPCGATPDSCNCVESVEGKKICGADPCGPECSSDAECDAIVPGAICQTPDTGCCGQTCIFPCGEAPLTLTSPSTNSGG